MNLQTFLFLIDLPNDFANNFLPLCIRRKIPYMGTYSSHLSLKCTQYDTEKSVRIRTYWEIGSMPWRGESRINIENLAKLP